MGEEGPDSLKYPIEGQVNRVHRVRILEISLWSAVIENTEVIRPGSTLVLDITLGGRQIKCYVVHSLIHRRERQPDREEALIYHTQLEFLSSQ